MPLVCTATGSGGGSTGTGSAAGSASTGSGAGPQDQPPHLLPAESDKPTASTDNKLACLIDRVDGKRVVRSGDAEKLDVKCTGIVDDSGTLKAIPHSANVKIKWTASTQVGLLSTILWDIAVYTAPTKVEGSANENAIHASATATRSSMRCARCMR